MKLVFLGTAGYHPNERRQTSALMLPEVSVALDAGTGLFRARAYLRTDTFDIFITHAHLDHVVGLTYMFDIAPGKNVQKVVVHGDAQKLAAIEKHLFDEALFPVKPPLQFRPLAERVPLPQGGTLTHFPLVHPGGSIGFRLDWPGRSMAYVTDTTAREDSPYIEKIRGVDLLVHECNFPDGSEQDAELTGHSCTTPVARVAKKAGARRLILAHVNPMLPDDDPVGMATARREFPGVELAHDGMEVEF
jgi:ribonuclease Z